jgi:hypothetical protein
MIRPFLSPFLPLALLVPLAAAAAQQRLCFSIENGPASGRNSANARSTVGVRVNGFGAAGQLFVNPGGGQTAAQTCDALEAGLRARGFTTARPQPNVVCVTLGPGGRPIQDGGGIGNDDTEFDLDSSIQVPPPVVGMLKPNGVTIPKCHARMVARAPGAIRLLFDVETAQGTVQVPVQVPFQGNEPTEAINQRLRQALEGAGFWVNEVRTEPILAATVSARREAFGVDRMRNGNRVTHAVMLLDGPPQSVPLELVALELTSGAPVLTGSVDYGQGAAQNAIDRPILRGASPGGAPPRVGGSFDVFVEFAPPGAPGALLLGARRAALPLPPALTRGLLLVDPAGMVTVPAATNAAGQAALRVAVGNHAALAGVPLHWQGVVATLAPLGLSVSNGLVVTLEP